MAQKTIISCIPNQEQFMRLLDKNPGLIIIKLGATWCGPCKRIKPVVDAFFASSPDNVVCCEIDVDECHEFYTFLKGKRMVNGIPIILCYKKGNVQFIPDDSVTGSDPNELDKFFRRCGAHLISLAPKIRKN